MKPSTKNLKSIVYGLAALSVIAFLAGFLQDTKFAFTIYTLYFILCVVGVKLIVMTFKSKATVVLRGFLFLTGFSSTVFFLFFVFAVIGNLLSGVGITEFMELVEDFLYFIALLFLIGIVGSIVLLKMKKIQ